jgi:hypothetical protein
MILLPFHDDIGMEMDGASDAMTGADNTPQDSMEMTDNSRSECEL